MTIFTCQAWGGCQTGNQVGGLDKHNINIMAFLLVSGFLCVHCMPGQAHKQQSPNHQLAIPGYVYSTQSALCNIVQ